VRNLADTGTHHEDLIPVDLSQPLVLEVHNPNGDVTIRAAERSDVLVSHIIHGFSDDEVEFSIDAHENQIAVRARPRNGAGWGGFSADVDLDAVVGQISKAFRWGGPWSPGKLGKVRVPSSGQAWCDITIDVPRAISGRFALQTASGDIRVEGVTGEIALHTASGDGRVIQSDGNLTLRTANGDLNVEGTRGRLTVQAASGDLRVTAAQIEGFDIQTASGDVVLDALLSGDGPCHAQTASGDVRLTLRRPTGAGEEPAATLAFHTVSGDAHVTSPFRKTARRLWQAGAGNGGPRIEVKTVSGDLTAGIAAAESPFVPASPAPPADDVLVAPPVAPAPPAPPPAPPPPESWVHGEGNATVPNVGGEAPQPTAHSDTDRLAVLEAVERGEIDVEEALRRLEAVDATTSP
jgi:hypothetical protein